MSTDTTPAPIGADALRAVIAEMRSKEARGAEATEHELGEMADRLTQALDQYDAALASAAPQPAAQQEPVAWMDDGTLRAGSEATAYRVVTDATKRGMTASLAASFITPLYAHPAAPAAQGDAEDAARLDWLLGEGRSMAIDSCDGEYRVVDAKWGLVVTDWMPTPRAAIDAARAAKEWSAREQNA